VESVYQLVTDTSSTVLGWIAEKYSSWKLRRERSNSTSALPQLSENITLPATGLLFVILCFLPLHNKAGLLHSKGQFIFVADVLRNVFFFIGTLLGRLMPY